MSNLSQRGKWAEKEVQKYLVSRSDSDIGFAWHRYPDTRAARGIIASQPSDYIVSYRKWVHHLEIKETEHPNRLSRGKISQYPVLKKFFLAGMPCVCVVYRSHHDNWTYFTQDELFLIGDPPPSFMYVIGRLPTAEAVLSHLYQP